MDAYLDYGPTLPNRYGYPLVRLLARDPETLFAYWEGGTVLRISDLTAGTQRCFSTLEVGSWYAPADPEHHYEAEVGEFSSGKFVAVAKSNRVKTPRRGRAVVMDPEWPLTLDEQRELIEPSQGWSSPPGFGSSRR